MPPDQINPLGVKQVWKGTGGTARVKMLEPGKAYRFRVRPTNCDGLEGAVSESVVSSHHGAASTCLVVMMEDICEEHGVERKLCVGGFPAYCPSSFDDVGGVHHTLDVQRFLSTYGRGPHSAEMYTSIACRVQGAFLFCLFLSGTVIRQKKKALQPPLRVLRWLTPCFLPPPP